MTLSRCSLLLPGYHLEDFPTHLVGDRAAELLSAWTALWHPALLAMTGQLPTWYPAATPPDPDTLDGVLIVAPQLSRERLPTGWIERFAETLSRNPPLLEAAPRRTDTVRPILEAASVDPNGVVPDLVGDFFALGYAFLQVELLTRVMRHTTLLSTEKFAEVAVAAARSAVEGDSVTTKDRIAQALDLLADARNHYYSVDYYLLDVTLLAPTTMGEALRARLAGGSPTSLLASGTLIERMAAEHPDTLAELRRGIDRGTACVVGGQRDSSVPGFRSPEAMLAEFIAGEEIYQHYLGKGASVFGQYESSFSPRWPTLLAMLGFQGALHVSFDGGSLPSSDQPKTWWSGPDGGRIEAVSTIPYDVAQPETWLALADRVADSLSHDHISTLLFAGWAGHESEFAEDLRRIARYGTVLGKLATLEEYFAESRRVDDWITFSTQASSELLTAEPRHDPLSTAVSAHRDQAIGVYRELADGLIDTTPLVPADESTPPGARVVVNPWSFPASRRIENRLYDRVPPCGFSRLDQVAPPPKAPLGEGLTLRNERIEIVLSAKTGGIQSMRRHKDRGTRISQRLVFCDRRTSGRAYRAASDDETPEANVEMIAEEVAITANDESRASITSKGTLKNSSDVLLARFTQTTSILRGLSLAVVDVELEPERLCEGSLKNSYYASRLVWRGDSLGIRRGVEWAGYEVRREWIAANEWVEIADSTGTITCFAHGLPWHRAVGPSRLDTLIASEGETQRRFRFAVALDEPYPTQLALALAAADVPPMLCTLGADPPAQGWFLHVSAQNVIVTHLSPLDSSRHGVRLRLIETEGREARVTLDAFRAISKAAFTDFRGESSEVVSCGMISIAEGRATFHMGPLAWVQIEVEW